MNYYEDSILSPHFISGKQMIKYIKGDITKQKTGLILHSVNCQGVMGSGVALAIRKKWPVVYDEYMKAPQGHKALGRIQLVYITDTLHVCNLWGQEFFGNDGKVYADINAIRNGLEQAFDFCTHEKFVLKMPRIGALRGGLDWDTEVVPVIEEIMEKYPDVEVQIIDIV